MPTKTTMMTVIVMLKCLVQHLIFDTTNKTLYNLKEFFKHRRNESKNHPNKTNSSTFFMFPRDYVILVLFIVFIYMGFASVVPSRNTAYRISSHSWSFFFFSFLACYNLATDFVQRRITIVIHARQIRSTTTNERVGIFLLLSNSLFRVTVVVSMMTMTLMIRQYYFHSYHYHF